MDESFFDLVMSISCRADTKNSEQHFGATLSLVINLICWTPCLQNNYIINLFQDLI